MRKGKLASLAMLIAAVVAVLGGLFGSAIDAWASGAGQVAITTIIPDTVQITHKVDIYVRLSNNSSRQISFDGFIYHGGSGWSGDDYPYTVSSGEVYDTVGESGMRHFWRGTIQPGSSVTYSLPTFSGGTGTISVAGVFIVTTSQGVVNFTKDISVVATTATPSPTVTSTPTSTATPQPTSTSTPNPTATPSPTPSPTPAVPVVFSMGTGVTGQVGTYVNVPVTIIGGSPVSYVGVVVKYDPAALQLAAFPNAPCNLGSARNRRWPNSLVEMDFVPSQPVVANCKILIQFKVLKEGQTTLTFVTDLAQDGFRTIAMNGSWPNYAAVPFTTINGSVVGKPAPVVTATLSNYSGGVWTSGGSILLHYQSNSAFNIHYRLSWNSGCPIKSTYPGFTITDTGAGWNYNQAWGFSLLPHGTGNCTFTVTGYDYLGNQISPNPTTVTVYYR